MRLVELCSHTIDIGGKLIITGVGKSGHIGRKIAATLSSVGTPSVFMHPVEARHGDLGLIQENDLMLAISYSGETEELLVVLPPAKRLGVQ
ncbi:MAG: SIS domain-containing protein, partial [Lentisphaeria bacterium]|nr:SIS domain-containing protein [Lentisphaeria bacterium]